MIIKGKRWGGGGGGGEGGIYNSTTEDNKCDKGTCVHT